MRFLLLRQAYLAHVALHQLHGAVETTEAMIETGVMLDVAYTDQSRALAAMGRTERAIEAQRASARNAPTARRSFQLWSLATLQHFAGEGDAALKTIARALRFAGPDRPLIKAHRAYIALDLGTIVSELETIRRELAASPSGQGYGQFLLGMIAHLLGDQPKATVHLQAFLRRNASIDETKRLTLREELRRARLALAEFSSQ
ncbi:MAG: hypothetical protein AAGE52_06240 [Myxococcota bacterium]